MKEELYADLWTAVVEHVPEKSREDAAADFVNILVDHGVKDSVLDGLLGIDHYLDKAIEYVLDGEQIEEDDYEEDEDY